MKRKEKAFDCVEFQHEAGAAVAKQMEGMTVAEKVAHSARLAEAMRKRQEQARQQVKPA